MGKIRYDSMCIGRMQKYFFGSISRGRNQNYSNRKYFGSKVFEKNVITKS